MAALPQKVNLALGLATSPQAAATLALSSLAEPFAQAWQQQHTAWADWHTAREARCQAFDLPDALGEQLRRSAQVLKAHSDKTFNGAMVASLSVPWGNRGEERGGYLYTRRVYCGIGGSAELLPQPARIRIGFNGWKDVRDLPTLPLGRGLHGFSLSADQLCGHDILDFTWQWQDGAWLGEDIELKLAR